MLQYLVRQNTVNGELKGSKHGSPCQPGYALLDGYQGRVSANAQPARLPGETVCSNPIVILSEAKDLLFRGSDKKQPLRFTGNP
jgi:hypothetical protein